MSAVRFFISVVFIGLMGLSGAVFSQDYPNKPIRIITSSAGGGNDFASRLVGQGLTASMGQQIIIDNRSGVAASEATAKAAPDGYTLTVAGPAVWVFPLLRPAPYDVLKDFAPITVMTRAPNVLVIHPALPVKSVKELIVLAKAHPGELNYASGPSGGGAHLAMEAFKHMAGVNIVRVAYKGGAPSLPDLFAGRVQLTIDDAPSLMPYAKVGKLKALAVTTAQRTTLYPDLPTVAESGLPGYESSAITGLLAPIKTPSAIIRKLNQEVVRILNTPDVKSKFFSAGAEVVANSPDEFLSELKNEIDVLGKTIKDAGIIAD